MKLSTFTSLLTVFSGLVASAPVADAEISGIEARSTATYYPSLVVSIYSPSGGYVSNYVSIYRSTWQGTQYDSNSLLAYTFPQGYPGKTCTFSFQNGNYAGGTRKVQLFSVGDAISPSNTFDHRPYRNIGYGIFTISTDGKTATWDDIPTPTFACPSSPTTLGFEVVPEGDSDWAGWDQSAGLAIVVL